MPPSNHKLANLSVDASPKPSRDSNGAVQAKRCELVFPCEPAEVVTGRSPETAPFVVAIAAGSKREAAEGYDAGIQIFFERQRVTAGGFSKTRLIYRAPDYGTRLMPRLKMDPLPTLPLRCRIHTPAGRPQGCPAPQRKPHPWPPCARSRPRRSSPPGSSNQETSASRQC